MNLWKILSGLGQANWRQAIDNLPQATIEMQINNNRSNGIRLRLRLDLALQLGKAQRDSEKLVFPQHRTPNFCGESTAILTTGHLDRSFLTLT